MQKYIMHYLYEEHVQKGNRKRKPICHGLDKDKIYAAIKQWRHRQLQERKEEDEDIYTCNMRILDLRVEEGCHNRENGIYYVNWIVKGREGYDKSTRNLRSTVH